jgi:hypothetical protein
MIELDAARYRLSPLRPVADLRTVIKNIEDVDNAAAVVDPVDNAMDAAPCAVTASERPNSSLPSRCWSTASAALTPLVRLCAKTWYGWPGAPQAADAEHACWLNVAGRVLTSQLRSSPCRLQGLSAPYPSASSAPVRP